MVCHWTGIHWNGEEKGFNVFKEVVRRLHARFDNLIWMKLSELSRYWAAKELTRITQSKNKVEFRAPFACPDYTVSISKKVEGQPSIRKQGIYQTLKKVSGPLQLRSHTWCEQNETVILCFNLAKGTSEINWS